MTNEKPARDSEDGNLEEQPPNQTPPGFDDRGEVTSQSKERQREERGNRGPDEEPSFGQKA